MIDREKFESNVDYTTVLDGFEGPLDLLLKLIEQAEIEIEKIFVSQVTDQFLAYMRGLPYLDVDKVSDYLAIAATILKYKARTLVPPVDEEEDFGLEEDEQELINALQERYRMQYSLIKEETPKLKELETIGYFYKEPDKNVGEVRTVFTLDNLTQEGLIDALKMLLLRQERKFHETEVREIPRDEFTVSQKADFLRNTFFDAEQELRFIDLFEYDSSRSEIVTTFQALLELLKYQFLLVRQDLTFGDIFISRNPEFKEGDNIGQFDEYD